MFYMHKETGSVDTREGWIESYPQEELEERGLTAEQAFAKDEGKVLLQITPEYCIQDGDCGTCSLVRQGLDCQGFPVSQVFFGSQWWIRKKRR